MAVLEGVPSEEDEYCGGLLGGATEVCVACAFACQCLDANIFDNVVDGGSGFFEVGFGPERDCSDFEDHVCREMDFEVGVILQWGLERRCKRAAGAWVAIR